MRYLYTTDGVSIDAALIEAGVAFAWPDDGQHRDQLVGVEQDAEALGAGCLHAR